MRIALYRITQTFEFARYMDWQPLIALTLVAAAMSAMMMSMIPALAALIGAAAGVLSAHSSNQIRKSTSENNLMTQYLGFIQSLQSEVSRTNSENADLRERLAKNEVEIARLLDRIRHLEDKAS